MNCFKQSTARNNFWYFLIVEIASKLEMKLLAQIRFSSFNIFLSLRSVATNDRKQNKCHDTVLNNKPRPFFWNSEEGKTYLGF